MNPTLKLYLWCGLVLTSASFIIIYFLDLGNKVGGWGATITAIVAMTLLMLLTNKMEEIEEQEKGK